MRCKFSGIGPLFSLLCWSCYAQFAFAQLDWHDNVVVFGTSNHEVCPLLTTMWNGGYRAFCMRDAFELSTRRSLLGGSAWESFSNVGIANTSDRFGATSDAENSYVWNFMDGSIRKIAHGTAVWPNIPPLQVDTASAPFVAFTLISDYAFDPIDSYLHGCFVHRETPSSAALTYFRSDDRAASIASRTPIDAALTIQDSSASLALGVTWSGEDEILWLAVTTDRPGTPGEQLRLYSSDDLGATWSAPLTPDSSTYAMLRPTLAGQNELIMMAYQRRNSASLSRDIYMTYSPDNGTSWSEPLQLTDHPYDDIFAKLLISDERIGLFYARAQTQSESGELFFRESSVTEPWVWSPEISVSDNSVLRVSEGYDATADANGFAAVWSSRVVGDDGDILFDASWRGVAANEPDSRNENKNPGIAYSRPGQIEYDFPQSQVNEIVLYDLLGRRVAQTLTSGRGYWVLPLFLPSGSYWAASPVSKTIKVQIVR